MRPLKSLALPLAAWALCAGPACVGDPPATFVQPDACKVALECYFGPEQTLANNAEFAGLFPEGEAALVIDTYGPEGRCWRGAAVLAESCADRCKGLLWQDCAVPYQLTCLDAQRTETGIPCTSAAECNGGTCPVRPFCAAACEPANALPCRFEDFASVGGQRQENAPLFSACPNESTCNAEESEFQGNTRPEPRFGCCDLPLHQGPESQPDPILIGSSPADGPEAQPCATTLTPAAP